LRYYRRGHFSVDAKLYIPVCRVRVHDYIEFLLKQTRPGPPFAWLSLDTIAALVLTSNAVGSDIHAMASQGTKARVPTRAKFKPCIRCIAL
jgi:hypothetical protein